MAYRTPQLQKDYFHSREDQSASAAPYQVGRVLLNYQQELIPRKKKTRGSPEGPDDFAGPARCF